MSKINVSDVSNVNENNRLNNNFLAALDKVLKRVLDSKETYPYTIEDLVTLLKAGGQHAQMLFEAADQVREKGFGKGVYLRGIIEFSNYCRKNCLYCGIRAANQINRYRMSHAEIIKAVSSIKDAAIGTVVLQSGEDPWWSIDKIVKLIKDIKNTFKITVTLSIGERSYPEYDLFKKAGADRFLLKIETTNQKIFRNMHPDDQLPRRAKCSTWLKELGYLNGSGCIIGLPGQTVKDIASDILWFRDMKMGMIGIGPFVPAKGTPLVNFSPGSTFMTLKALAVTRLICSQAFIPATTALETLENEAQVKALKAGANVIMLNFTPQKYREKYKIYNSKKAIEFKDVYEAIRKAGRFVIKEY
jgi:biotin synthase